VLTEIQNEHLFLPRPNRNGHFPNLVFMRIFLLCSAFLLTAQLVCGQTPDSIQLSTPGSFENPIVLTDCDSVQYFVGQVISIAGPVIKAKKTQGKDGAMGYLDLFKAYPDNPFSVVIYREALAFFDPLEQFEKKNVLIKGKVTTYKDKRTGTDRYSIVLRKPAQIEIRNP